MNEITSEDRLNAEKNGISYSLLHCRIYEMGWAKEKAITTIPRKQRKLTDWIEIARENGIERKTFIYRVCSMGWDLEKAATIPRCGRQKKYERKYPLEFLELADKNGIKCGTFRNRVRKGWGLQEAATLPPMPGKKINARS